MFHEHTSNSLRIARSLGLLSLGLISSSCGHTQAAPAPAATDTVMKTIQDYGRDHHGLLAPGNSAKPDESADLYSAHIKTLFAQEDFAQLEQIAKQERINKGRLLGGIWKIKSFYDSVRVPVFTGELTDADYARQIARVKKWIAAYPDSTTANLSLAFVYLSYASFARGSGFADSVSDSQWSLFHSRSDQAKAILLEASTLKDKDPAWYEAMQLVAHDEGWDKVRARELFDQATAFEPDYYHYYRRYADYLLPQWYGEPGDIRAFAEEISNRIPEPNGSMLYFQIVSSLACYCEESLRELPHVSYPIARQGYTNVTRFYGASNLNANRFAFMASMFKDQVAAREAFAALSSMDSEIWYKEEVFNSSRDWANAH
jgi:hypothetical protein